MNSERRSRLDHVWTLLDTWVPTVLIAGVMLLVLFESVGRTVLRSSIVWYVEVLAVLFTWTVFLAGAAGIRTGRAIAVDAFYSMFGPRVQRALLLFANVVTLLVGLAWGWLLILLTLEQGGLETVMLGIPFAARTIGVIVAFGLIAIYALRSLLRPAPPPEHSRAIEHSEE